MQLRRITDINQLNSDFGRIRCRAQLDSTNFEFENRPILQARTFAAGFTLTTASGNRVAQNRMPTNADLQAISLKNRNHDTLVTILATFMVSGIIASFIILTGWFLYSVAVELSGWNLQDFAHAIQGHRFN